MLSTTFDATADALYITLGHAQVVRTESLDEWTMVDVDRTGAPVGVEVIHPARQWPVSEFLDRYRIQGDMRRMFERLSRPQLKGTAI